VVKIQVILNTSDIISQGVALRDLVGAACPVFQHKIELCEQFLQSRLLGSQLLLSKKRKWLTATLPVFTTNFDPSK
jgi:hypothetical protein